MTDYLKNYKKQTNALINNTDSAESILNEVAEQLYKEWRGDEIYITVNTSQEESQGNVTISLKLASGSIRKQFYYRLIEIEQPMDKYYKVKIRAFQNPPTDWMIIDDADSLKEAIIEILGDKRITIVREMIKQMGNTIRVWEKEREEEN